MKRIIYLIAGFLAVVSCSIEPVEAYVESLVPMTISAGFREDASKTRLDGLNVLWSENDRIAVYDGSAVREFVLTEGAGTTVASFSGEVSSSATSFTAVYPYSRADLTDGVLSVTAPAEQTITDYSSDENALIMSASASKGEFFQFHNQAGLLRFSVAAGVSQVLIVPGGQGMVTVNLPGAAGTYEAALAPGDYQGLTMLMKSGQSWYIKSSDKAWTLGRNRLRSIGELPLTVEALPLRTPEEMTAFLSSAYGDDTRTAVLLNDISMSGCAMTPAADFAGVFEGMGHEVSGISAPLFGISHGTIRNLGITGTIDTAATETASLAIHNYGSISCVTNKVNLSVAAQGEVEESIVLGGIAAYNSGELKDCSNQGTVSFTGASTIKAIAIGGICGYSESAIDGCTNSGAVTVSAVCGSAVSALGQIEKAALNAGGILGAAYTAAPVSGCTNSGAVSVSFSSIDSAPASYGRNQVGGIVGSPYGDITECINKGKIIIDVRSSSGAAYSANDCTFDIGGISGGSYTQELNYQSPCDNTSIISCINDGDLEIRLDAVKSNSPIGGIAGWPNGEHTALRSKIQDCENRGNVTVSGAGKVRVGGVMGGTGFPDNCSNSGQIKITSANSASSLGGICGFHSQDHGIVNCSNTGDVISSVNIAAVGGLIGTFGNVSQASGAGCKVACRVESPASANASIGMIIGKFSGNAKDITIGTEAAPVDVSGTIVFNSTEHIIDDFTYTSYLCGTDNSSNQHVFYAVCNVVHVGDVYMAQGYVKYNDGTAAAGVSVSDGFSICVTDASGHYQLLTSPDTWYIYVSLPSDAVVNKKSDGRPDFFVKYNYPDTRYDFTLTRQAVENEFVIFAMADPQAHYSVRGSGTQKQKKADVLRFRDESVPAINSQIAAQSLPCYGITLGDIVYSENSRNSNSGMTSMRTYFKSINMPVFQTMGNHDFTYFYSSSPLTTDAASSTLYLRAQRKFEETFGPINYSFNRGDVHFVCMRDIIYNSDTANMDYSCGFTDEQYSWLQHDLANVPKDKMVVLCVHIPFLWELSSKHVKDVLNLMKQYSVAKVFSGHTHYKQYTANLYSGIPEYTHSAVCGQWWWSNFEGDGNPNGYTIYKFSGKTIADEYFIGVNDSMNTRDYQMRIYRGNIKTGGQYAYFQCSLSANDLLINVFNGDSRWTVKVYENGEYSGNASLMSYSKKTWNSVTAGTTYTVPSTSNQDWWAIGYHIGVRGRGTDNTSYYTTMWHMFKYTLKDASASVKVVATDGYGNSYECTDVISEDCWYPDYVKGINAI